MESDQNEIECFKIETTIRVKTSPAALTMLPLERAYRQTSPFMTRQHAYQCRNGKQIQKQYF
ncbi:MULTISPECIES: hypothetical protein [unclassified Janthinobacterium]|uniref:hypothetical protein n=1 Tax=unclassified Janthinobacterium TaxID=2610881 RepID=UPI001113CE27|nr:MULTISPECIES: hypothetical protein [unclassified Janthinobacterium]